MIAGINIALGKVEAICQDSRIEEDFANSIDMLILKNSNYKAYHIVLDQLNTHKSETLARLVAKHDNLKEELAIKGIAEDIKINENTRRLSNE